MTRASGIVRVEIGIDTQDPERLAPFWAEALGYAIGDLDRAGSYLDLLPPDPSLPAVYLQRVPEKKDRKNRLHLDLYATDPEVTVDRLVEFGATRTGEPQTGSEGGWWQVMADPEGNEFCVCRANGAATSV
jgi:predicted enzyme related to lactoylglutathione lyase